MRLNTQLRAESNSEAGPQVPGQQLLEHEGTGFSLQNDDGDAAAVPASTLEGG